MHPDEIEDIEIKLLLDALRLRYGYDFRNYSRASLRRRIRHCLTICEMEHVADLIPPLLHEGTFLNRIVYMMSVTVTAMFRDPLFFQALRDRVVPKLKTYPFITIWHAGCATGEEVYSLAILLKEEGLYERCQIFATDLNDHSLHKAKEGVYPLDKIKGYMENFQNYGGRASFSSYCHTQYDLVKMKESLKENIVFANHNLVTDEVFTQAHLILCRNVLIYFDTVLQDRVLNLFNNSLIRDGFLCLGVKESLQFSSVRDQFQALSKTQKIYRKKIAGALP